MKTYEERAKELENVLHIPQKRPHRSSWPDQGSSCSEDRARNKLQEGRKAFPAELLPNSKIRGMVELMVSKRL